MIHNNPTKQITERIGMPNEGQQQRLTCGLKPETGESNIKDAWDQKPKEES
jgi:hypothetical protein